MNLLYLYENPTLNRKATIRKEALRQEINNIENKYPNYSNQKATVQLREKKYQYNLLRDLTYFNMDVNKIKKDSQDQKEMYLKKLEKISRNKKDDKKIIKRENFYNAYILYHTIRLDLINWLLEGYKTKS